jgi:hypothetical protein
VDQYAIVAGNPAHAVGRRFDDEEITRHEARLYGGAGGAAREPGSPSAPSSTSR